MTNHSVTTCTSGSNITSKMRTTKERGLKTKVEKRSKFDKNNRKIRNKYIKELQKAIKTDQLDTIPLILQKELMTIAFASYKIKHTPVATATL